MPVIPKSGGPWSLFCTDCRVWTPNTANTEMRKEGFFASSHVCGIIQKDEVRDEDYRKDSGQTMNENLVKRLRDKASALDYDGWVDTAASLEEAADAIEELIEVIQNHDFLESLMKPDWIPVTERLPEKSGNYLTAFGDGTAMAVNEFMHPHGWLTEEGRKAHPNGKWYWGGVTHWMELPEPPKEEIVMCEDCKKEVTHGRK